MPNDNINSNFKNKKKKTTITIICCRVHQIWYKNLEISHITHHTSAITTTQLETACIIHLEQILPARAGNAMLGLEETWVTSTFQRNDISLYNSLQEAMIDMLLEVQLDKYSFFVLGSFRDTFNCAYDTALNDRMVNETELMWKWTWPLLRYYAVLVLSD